MNVIRLFERTSCFFQVALCVSHAFCMMALFMRFLHYKKISAKFEIVKYIILLIATQRNAKRVR